MRFKQCFCCGTLGHSWHLVSRETTRKWDENGQTYAIHGRGRVKRPSDASVGKLTEGTATDWVTRGHLINLFSVVSDVVRFLVIFQMLSSKIRGCPPGLEAHLVNITVSNLAKSHLV